MRKSWSGLLGLVENEMRMNPFDKNLFIFFGHNKKKVKILYWDGNGFCIWMKKLEQGIFPFKETDFYLQIQKKDLMNLLNGIDTRKQHKEIFYS